MYYSFFFWLLLFFSLLSLLANAQLPPPPSSNARRALDSLLQDYAYRAFLTTPPLPPKTGLVYDATVPSNLTGIHLSALRLRSGSLRTRGVPNYKEFRIPPGVVEQPYVERLVLVYRNLGNWSLTYYPLPDGYVYLAPVLGFLAYDATDLNATNLPELNVTQTSSDQPISIQFSELMRSPVPANGGGGSVVPQCVSFDLNGTVSFSNVLSDNVCTTFQQGHFSIVIESSTVVSPPPPPLPPSRRGDGGGGGGENKKKVWIIVGSVLGGFALLVVLSMLVICGFKYKKRSKMDKMERAADAGEALHMTNVGSTKAPAATGTRTQPSLETEYVP